MESETQGVSPSPAGAGDRGSVDASLQAVLQDLLSHPVVVVAREITRPGNVEKWAIAPKDALRLEGTILEHLHDAMMPSAIRALFGMVATLHQAERSPTAARTLVTVLARVEPQLRALWRADDLANDDTTFVGKPTLAEQAEQRSRTLLGASANGGVARSSAPPPDGAIAVRALHIPEIPRPTPRPRSVAVLSAAPPSAASPSAASPSASSPSVAPLKGSPKVRGPSRPRPQPRFLRDDLPPE
ncbi:MAG: hypothetical protein IPK13_07430 [Deltaproteobacteria bacterium]|nr:hypothetical protein [Deltaproteobacteria bacterium]